MIAVARALFRLGDETREINLAYGGDLRPGGFTETLFDLARAETQEGWRGLIYSYLAWPHYLDLSKNDEAHRLNICSFLRVTPASAGLSEYPDVVDPGTLPRGTRRLIKSRRLTRLREIMTKGRGKK